MAAKNTLVNASPWKLANLMHYLSQFQHRRRWYQLHSLSFLLTSHSVFENKHAFVWKSRLEMKLKSNWCEIIVQAGMTEMKTFFQQYASRGYYDNTRRRLLCRKVIFGILSKRFGIIFIQWVRYFEMQFYAELSTLPIILLYR